MRALNAPMNQRRSIRLKEYDYTEHGAYFVTICTQDKQCLFGEVIEDSMALNETEKMIQTIWSEIPIYYPWIEIDSFQIMPNHMHGIIIIDQDLQIGDHGGVAPTRIATNPNTVRANPCVCHEDANKTKTSKQANNPLSSWRKFSLAHIIARFKSITTNWYIESVK